jgi:hypothetical protein
MQLSHARLVPVPEAWVFWHGVGLEAGTAEGQVFHHVWVWCGAVACSSLRGGETGRMEQQLCRPMGWGFGRLAVLVLDHGVEKPSMI